MDEVQRHCTAEDCWTVLHGKVYNLTPYFGFHPGGAKILMACAGRDGTALFQKYHPWVNYEFLLSTCLVGTLGLAQAPVPSGAAPDVTETSDVAAAIGAAI